MNENLTRRVLGLEQRVDRLRQLLEGLRQPTKVCKSSRCLGGHADRTDNLLHVDD